MKSQDFSCKWSTMQWHGRLVWSTPDKDFWYAALSTFAVVNSELIFFSANFYADYLICNVGCSLLYLCHMQTSATACNLQKAILSCCFSSLNMDDKMHTLLLLQMKSLAFPGLFQHLFWWSVITRLLQNTNCVCTYCT